MRIILTLVLILLYAGSFAGDIPATKMPPEIKQKKELSLAASSNKDSDSVKKLIEQCKAASVPAGWNSSLVITLVFSILVFGLLVLIMASIILCKNDGNGRQTLRVLGILTIIILSVVVVIIGYSQAQLTPIIGLFGAIAGYLLGKENNSSKSSKK
jgi:uncharacterized protein YqhQ